MCVRVCVCVCVCVCACACVCVCVCVICSFVNTYAVVPSYTREASTSVLKTYNLTPAKSDKTETDTKQITQRDKHTPGRSTEK